MTLRQLVAEAEVVLRTGPHPERARLDAETLLLHVLAQNRAWLLAHIDDAADSETQTTFAELIVRRRAGEPIQYITGRAEFFGLPFAVAPGVLIPRPETEHIVEEVLRLAASFVPSSGLNIADIGTGSGAIAVALAHALPRCCITATDLSPQALKIARSNAYRNGVADRIEFLEGDLLAPLVGRSFSILASNPPYVPLRDRASLSAEVSEYEPHSALFAAEDGLEIYRRLIPDARVLLVAGGWLVMEIGFGQKAAVEKLLLASDYSEVHFVPDYQGIPRVAVCRRA
jgi:release factor glutamine methyltransferase